MRNSGSRCQTYECRTMVHVRPIVGGYAHVSWVRSACRETQAVLDAHAFHKGVLATHGVLGSVRHGFSEFVAVLAPDGHSPTDDLHQVVHSTMIRQEGIWCRNPSPGQLTLSPEGTDQLFFEPLNCSPPDNPSLNKTLKQHFQPLHSRIELKPTPPSVNYPFVARASALPSCQHNAIDLGRTLFVGTRLSAPTNLDHRERVAAELIAHFWDDSINNPVIVRLRSGGSVYSYVSAYSQHSCNLCLGVFISPKDFEDTRKAVDLMVSSRLTASELKLAKDRLRLTTSFADPLGRAIRDASTRLEGGPDEGFLAAVQATSTVDCSRVLRWSRHDITYEVPNHV